MEGLPGLKASATRQDRIWTMAFMGDLWRECSSPISDLRIASTVSMTERLRSRSLSASGIRWFFMLRRMLVIRCRRRCQSLLRKLGNPRVNRRFGLRHDAILHIPLARTRPRLLNEQVIPAGITPLGTPDEGLKCAHDRLLFDNQDLHG